MIKQLKIPLLLFVLAGCIGLLLRLYAITPIAWLNYSFLLHTHSHIMFLGWVLNVFFLAFVSNYNLASGKKYRNLFAFIQLLLGAMLIFFPLRGYDIVTIVLSSLHTFSFWVFTFYFFRDSGDDFSIVSQWFARCSLFLFVLSSFGPFALGPMIANGMAHTKWYYFAVYYYLHFQYNGVFIFGVLSLYFKLLEDRGIPYNGALARKSGIVLLVSLFPTYFLSILFAEPHIIFNVIVFSGALLQLWALFYFFKVMREIRHGFNYSSTRLIAIAFLCFILKATLQLLSAHPITAQIAFETRPVIIAYLHLVMIGVVTFFLVAWYIEKGLITLHSKFSVYLLMIGFTGSEIMMLIWGFPSMNTFIDFHIPSFLLLFSFLMVFAFGIFTYRFTATER